MTQGRAPGAGLLRLYPRSWRDRYEAEVLAVLEAAPLRRRGRLDLARGAIDAWLHARSRVPVAAAFLAGGIWTIAGTWIVAQPAPPDWPGYLVETLLPAIAAVAAGAVALVGAWAVGSDAAGRAGVVAIGLALAGHGAWLAVLIAAFVGLDYGALTAVGQALGAVGCALVGLALVRTGQERIGGVLVLAPTVLLFGWPIAWLAFGLAWTMIGMFLLAEPGTDHSRLSPSG